MVLTDICFEDFNSSFKSRRAPGYSAETLEWDPSISESPLQRFKRLEHEMEALKSELKQLSTAKGDSESETGPTQLDYDPLSVLSQVEALQKQAASLHLESIGAKVDAKKFDANSKKYSFLYKSFKRSNFIINISFKRQLLIDQINEAKKALPGKELKSQKIDGDVPIVFKIFNDVDSSSIEKASKVF